MLSGTSEGVTPSNSIFFFASFRLQQVEDVLEEEKITGHSSGPNKNFQQ
jgi:hypothetical protein